MNKTLDCEIQKVVLYIDLATIPSLNFFLDFIENYQDRKTIRIFGLARFEITQDIIDKYSNNIINFYSTKGGQLENIINCLQNIFIKHNALEISIHTNLFHSVGILIPIIRFINKYKNINGVSFHLYDDGAEGIINLDRLSQLDNLDSIIESEKSNLQNIIIGQSDKMRDVTRYLWNTIYPTTYHLLSEKAFDNQNLSTLKKEIGKYQLIDWSRYDKLNSEQKILMFNILRIPLESIDLLVSKSRNNKVFIFTGTTTFSQEADELFLLEALHHVALKQYVEPNGKYFIGNDYITMIKGHPNSEDINLKLSRNFPEIKHLPAHIPFEVLTMLGYKFEKIGGFSSTSYLSIPVEKITDVIFMTQNNCHKEKNYVEFMQEKFMQEMAKYLSKEKLHYYTELFN